jgi:hypothetical protein
MAPRRQQSSPRKIVLAETRKKALELRKQGKNYQEIADAVGWPNRSYACRYVMREIRNLPGEEAAEIRKLEMERLDALTDAVWMTAMAGDTRAVETMLKLMERRSRLLGLDSPHKISHGAEEGISMIGSLMAAIRGAEEDDTESSDDEPEGGEKSGDDPGEDDGESEPDQ